MHPIHPLMHNYPGAAFHSPMHPWDHGNVNGPHLAMASGGDSMGYWQHIPVELPEGPPPHEQWKLPIAMIAAMEGRGTGVYGMTLSGGMPLNYGWPKYGPVSVVSYEQGWAE